MKIVLDASLAIAAFTREEHTDAAQAVMREIALHGAEAPSLWRLEVANVLRTLVLRGRASNAFADDVLATLSAFPIAIDPETDQRAWSETLLLSRELGLTLYDAAYLELAIRREARLATLDKPLTAAALRCGVEVLPG
ncbi:type II toxin-antitoxin system VapC family toxin [Caulobacter segnis]|uniref:Ribonuclease VapC n=1 Tax=Caulobacter segnis TaxID=88688 RepID=A0A2W5UU51_9CAUL|nr:type II toxin-antitoxin system VapC family toxin [Caulobacter segnis]PZR31299.1 MAG: VapC toxin family PIN domain ribonuclease [Caulobacter segnis]